MRLLQLELEVPGLILTRDNILLLEFFVSTVKCLMPILALLPISSSL